MISGQTSIETSPSYLHLGLTTTLVIGISAILISEGGYTISAGLVLLGYVELCFSIKYAVFNKESVDIVFPLRIAFRKTTIGYSDISRVSQATGSYWDGKLLKIEYYNRRSLKKAFLHFPTREWNKIRFLVESKGIRTE